MEYPDTATHAPDCLQQDEPHPPTLLISFRPDRNGTVMVRIWETCWGCGATTVYSGDRLPWRTFHRAWKGSMATWIATWEHRHNLGGRVT